MKKNFKFYALIWAILLALFNLVVFLVRPIIPGFVIVYDARFWIAFVFIVAAFNSGEQRLIQKSTVTADKNPSCSTSPGNNTTDKVFLLSITEVNKYFNSDSARQCQGTAYCYAQGAYKASNGNCWWWLRSPGLSSDYAAFVRNSGSVDDIGHGVSYGYNAVRPALWINLGYIK